MFLEYSLLWTLVTFMFTYTAYWRSVSIDMYRTRNDTEINSNNHSRWWSSTNLYKTYSSNTMSGLVTRHIIVRQGSRPHYNTMAKCYFVLNQVLRWMKFSQNKTQCLAANALEQSWVHSYSILQNSGIWGSAFIYTVRCDELKLTLGNLFLCYLIGIISWSSWK
jgi:hypothetical protein